MANKDHLQILERVPAWNKWRTENQLIRPDLSSADLSEVNLKRANFEEAARVLFGNRKDRNARVNSICIMIGLSLLCFCVIEI